LAIKDLVKVFQMLAIDAKLHVNTLRAGLRYIRTLISA